MQKCLFSAPDGPAGPGTRETIHLVTPPSSSASTSGASADDTVKAAPEAVDASKDSTAPALVWPPPDEELDDWHVIPLNPPAASGAPQRKPLPAWLANHRAAKSGVGSAGAPGLGTTPRVMTPSPSGSAIRAVSASPLEDTAKFPNETTTAIAAMRRTSAQAGTAPAVAVNLAPVAQPAVPRPVAAFPAARSRPAPQPAASPWNSVVRRAAVVVLALLAVGQAAYIGARLFMAPPVANTSILTVDSAPDGAEVFINGERRGVTPFKVELPAGAHSLELRKNGRTRTIPLVLAAGVQASQYVELGGASTSGSGSSGATSGNTAPRPSSASPPGTSATGSAGSGQSGGAAPAGTGATGLAGGATDAGTTAAAAAADMPGSSRGWVVIESGLNLSVLRNGEMLGSSEEGRLALPAGRQELELVNDAVGYRAVMTVQVPPGRPVTVPVELPQSLLNVTATPSARVWVDGREIGNTPVSQLALPVGQHEVRFEHPEFGERRMTVLVRVGATTQAAVDFTR